MIERIKVNEDLQVKLFIGLMLVVALILMVIDGAMTDKAITKCINSNSNTAICDGLR